MEEKNNLNNSRLSQENKLYLKNKVSNQGKIETITFINILTKNRNEISNTSRIFILV